MRIRLSTRGLIALVSVLVAFMFVVVLTRASAAQTNRSQGAFDGVIERNVAESFTRGRQIFRFDTFGSEAFWGGRLRLHQAIIGARFGGVGPGLSPIAALQAGLKVDVEMVPPGLIGRLRGGQVDLNDPAVTIELLEARAVVGVTAFKTGNQVTGVGFQCALCHSTVDDSVIPGVGTRLDGWPNRDLNVGAIIALAPDLTPFTELLQLDDATVRRVLNSWGPGKFDAELILDGKAFQPDGRSAATLIPAAFGLAGVNAHTYTGNWGTVTYWNAFVANLEMHGNGRFFDPRLANAAKFPIAARAGLFNVVPTGADQITPKLADLHFYQLAIPAPRPPDGSFDRIAAERGQLVFNSAGCARCHVPPIFTEPGWNLHTGEEIGIDNFQASRAPDDRYRTTPLRGLFARAKGGFYHDGRFPTMRAVVDHYDRFFGLRLSEGDKVNLVEYLKSL